jgi:ATP-dependent Lon protease
MPSQDRAFLWKTVADDVLKMIDYIDNPARFSDLVALYVTLPLDELQTSSIPRIVERLKKSIFT